MDIDHAPPQLLVGFWRGFKHSDFHPIKVSVGHLHFRGRPCAFLPKRNDDEIERDQVVAQPQGVDQVTLQVAGRKRDAVNCGTRLTPAGILTNSTFGVGCFVFRANESREWGARGRAISLCGPGGSETCYGKPGRSACFCHLSAGIEGAGQQPGSLRCFDLPS